MASKKAEAGFELASIGSISARTSSTWSVLTSAVRSFLWQKIKRLALEKEFVRLPRCVVGMEACLSAHFVSRTLRSLGFEPRIIPAKYTKHFIKGQKNDFNDAEAIAEAALRPNLKLVREKTQEQLDLQALHRVRARLCAGRPPSTRSVPFCSSKGPRCDPAPGLFRSLADA